MILAVALLTMVQAPDTPRVEFAEESPLLELNVSWPARADAISPLRAALIRDKDRRKRQWSNAARAFRRQAHAESFPFSRHVFSVEWQVEGITPQLVSLSAITNAYTGGGHGRQGYDILLWDQLRNRTVALAPLLEFEALAPRFCAIYPNALRNHLGEGTMPEDDERWNCPTVTGRPVAQADTDGNGRFDTLRFFMAVNYFDAEGYSVDVPVVAADIARLPDGYRPAFEIPGERRPPTSE